VVLSIVGDSVLVPLDCECREVASAAAFVMVHSRTIDVPDLMAGSADAHTPIDIVEEELIIMRLILWVR
jgi:hypothetical protein